MTLNSSKKARLINSFWSNLKQSNHVDTAFEPALQKYNDYIYYKTP